jgi:two-component system, chemotaxis family, response regulator Rcp1
MMPAMQTKPEVLLVDDNPADIDLTRDILSRCSWPHETRTVADGAQAMAFLHREGKYAEEDPPDLIILDLNLPRKDGRAVLAELRADPSLRTTPVVVFSSSQTQPDILRCFELGANSYVSKPGNLQGFVSSVTSIGEYWLGHAALPPRKKA